MFALRNIRYLFKVYIFTWILLSYRYFIIFIFFFFTTCVKFNSLISIKVIFLSKDSSLKRWFTRSQLQFLVNKVYLFDYYFEQLFKTKGRSYSFFFPIRQRYSRCIVVWQFKFLSLFIVYLTSLSCLPSTSLLYLCLPSTSIVYVHYRRKKRFSMYATWLIPVLMAVYKRIKIFYESV